MHQVQSAIKDGNLMVRPKQSNRRTYDQNSLLDDGSVNWKGFDREKLLQDLRMTAANQKISRLRHPEVRYEVTDHCNAECIMCPREVHKLGRPHGIVR